jgi:hypothetical protein
MSMKPFREGSDEWVFGALVASVLTSTIGLNAAWLREARGVPAAANPASAVAKAPDGAAVQMSGGAASAVLLTAANRTAQP